MLSLRETVKYSLRPSAIDQDAIRQHNVTVVENIVLFNEHSGTYVLITDAEAYIIKVAEWEQRTAAS